MRKMTFLLLTFLIGITASMNAQVRIGSLEEPSAAAVLDLNATDDTVDGTLALALPRVNLDSNTAKLNDGKTTPLNGMLVYNTNADLGEGVYIWTGGDNGRWMQLHEGDFIEGDGIVGNEVTTAGTGLEITGNGTTRTPLSVSIKDQGVDTEQLADKSVTAEKLDDMGAAKDQILSYDGTKWVPTPIKQIHSWLINYTGEILPGEVVSMNTEFQEGCNASNTWSRLYGTSATTVLSQNNSIIYLRNVIDKKVSNIGIRFYCYK